MSGDTLPAVCCLRVTEIFFSNSSRSNYDELALYAAAAAVNPTVVLAPTFVDYLVSPTELTSKSILTELCPFSPILSGEAEVLSLNVL